MKFIGSIVAILLAVIALPCQADCIDDAAAFHRVNPRLLRVIAEYESSMSTYAVNRNKNGSEDIGLMQINTSWLPTLARYGIRREHLYNGCVSAYVGAWILASNVRRFGPTWKAVGAYNAVTPSKQLVYASAIYRRYMQQGR
ncbi:MULTISPECIES: lytic transglycosylase domain-containing protein [Burkholderia]|uniref:lytic transglycosylase domain-containing protein n=1 Tax=Burkholderia TaxID=32008 RepID=UPI0007531A17|nr:MULTISPECIES: lytic transglycosylase domain-containing protein [Burkholderia]AOJ73587.1 lytic transglycosylase [Burkholderia savannae]KVG43045.1 lytic transglycosylase [Burkholderia sp. MSMB0265]KVG87544.1 lytic transglycosylase [Burkholderia sp. MSMB2040]KVG92063.1 lytic transglycosylase [Burkholderia sp. MSMB2042]KVH01134.1 lytic transglycosylase [Burkholderia sp. MSMB2041]